MRGGTTWQSLSRIVHQIKQTKKTIKLKHLTYNQIDFKKYDECIQKSINSRIYALSWYLDEVTKHDWEILVLNDYKAVMPLPFKRVKRKFLKRMITQPFFCQQLGIFSLTELDTVAFTLFTTQFFKFSIFNYHFNAFNTKALSKGDNLKSNVNFELNLNKSYDELSKNYSKNLKRNIKKATKENLTITDKVTISDFILMKDNTKKHQIKKQQYTVMTNLLKVIQAKKMGSFYAVKHDDEFIAIAFFTKTSTRLVHLFSTSTTRGKEMGAIPFLFDTIIKENANTNRIFDFEGSMIKGVAQFFKSFGAIDIPYQITRL